MRKRRKHHKNRPSGLKYKVTTNSGWFNKGHKSWNKGKAWSKKVRSKISNSLKGRSLEQLHKENCHCSVCKAKRFELNGVNHPSYILGLDRTYPLDFFKIRNKILKRDNYTCQNCFKYGNTIHHIDYNKKNNNENNLITLCHTCHAKTTVVKSDKRLYWIKKYRKIAI